MRLSSSPPVFTWPAPWKVWGLPAKVSVTSFLVADELGGALAEQGVVRSRWARRDLPPGIELPHGREVDARDDDGRAAVRGRDRVGELRQRARRAPAACWAAYRGRACWPGDDDVGAEAAELVVQLARRGRRRASAAPWRRRPRRSARPAPRASARAGGAASGAAGWRARTGSSVASQGVGGVGLSAARMLGVCPGDGDDQRQRDDDRQQHQVQQRAGAVGGEDVAAERPGQRRSGDDSRPFRR